MDMDADAELTFEISELEVAIADIERQQQELADAAESLRCVLRKLRALQDGHPGGAEP